MDWRRTMAICNAVQTSSAGMVASTPHDDLARIQVQYGGQIQLAAFGADVGRRSPSSSGSTK
ncbi:hypothetical protein XalbCFBP2523_04420 [Xanthomonas albilineans]|nr:hypothetical protein XalbCFBP2523_04420 [Xanthomonas albilineans]